MTISKHLPTHQNSPPPKNTTIIHTTDQVILSNSSLMVVLKFIVKCNYSSGIKTIKKMCGPSSNCSVSSARRQQFIKIASTMGRVSENVVQLPQTTRCEDVIQGW
uniref:Uncharacterized protein n=1 Tax=Micrurus spixii TaxID=129469 RepID=A0A2D4LFD8_9SAUR